MGVHGLGRSFTFFYLIIAVSRKTSYIKQHCESLANCGSQTSTNDVSLMPLNTALYRLPSTHRTWTGLPTAGGLALSSGSCNIPTLIWRVPTCQQCYKYLKANIYLFLCPRQKIKIVRRYAWLKHKHTNYTISNTNCTIITKYTKTNFTT